MRVDSIIAINTKQQHSPRTRQLSSTSTNENATGTSFEEYLRATLQQTSNTTSTRNAENQVAGLLIGYFSNLRIQNKTEPNPEGNTG